MDSFRSLGVDERIVVALEAAGAVHPFPVQSLTIPDALAGKDVGGKAKTGSGKTIAFAVPIVQRVKAGAKPGRPHALVLVPTRELAAQVHATVDSLASAVGLQTLAAYGGTPLPPQIKALRSGVDVVVATPGRLVDLVEQGEIDLSSLTMVVVDEADRMADMGFLPPVEWLLRRATAPHQTLLFSATLDGDVKHLTRHYMKDPVLREVEETQVTVESMAHAFLAVHHMDKARVVASIAAGGERTMVFCGTKRGADRTARDLKDLGVRVGAIHGDLRQQARERALAQFAAGRVPVLVCTDVAARGLHIEGVDIVVHYDPPADHKEYLHRSGRTARAGAAGTAVSLWEYNQHYDAQRIQKTLGIEAPLVEVFSNDPRLRDLGSLVTVPA
ncbi:MAG TPA: DEAD/DEAH box helicase [Acidimicrobiales bacterium]|nr:DEAD/DEAH box helicase [Acidimicrobiales bacterium]